MKKTMVTFVSILLISILAACDSTNDDTPMNDQAEIETETPVEQKETDGTDEDMVENDETVDENDTETNENSATDATDKDEKMKQLEFSEIELEVEYSGDKEYEAEIEKKSTGEYKSELEDELNNKHLKGNEAFDHIYPIVEKLNINAESTKEEVIKEVLQAFDLDDNYEEFEVEFTFHDGTKTEFKDK